MPTYRKNIYRQELIQKYGVVAGLPLFDQRSAEHIKVRINRAPKSIAVATDTRKLAHLAIQMKIGEEQQRVLDAFCSVPDGTNKEIASLLKTDASTVSARNNELRKLGLITFSTKRQCAITGRIVTSWCTKK
jgi:DNA-binding NarL/FixJ family response regulator